MKIHKQHNAKFVTMFELSNMGETALKSHARGTKHKNNLKNTKSKFLLQQNTTQRTTQLLTAVAICYHL